MGPQIIVLTCVQSWSVANNWRATSHLDYSEKAPDAVQPLGKNGWVRWCQENSYSSSSELLEKLAGHLHTFWLATMKNDLIRMTYYFTTSVWIVEDTTELALDRPFWQHMELCTEMVQAKQRWWWR